MARLTEPNLRTALEIISRYPRPKSALIPLLHLAQEQDGYVADDAIEHIAELLGLTPAEVLGTCSFYEMFKREPVGRYLVNICTNLSCQLMGAEELLHHAEHTLGIRPGGTTEDGSITLEDVECIAACTEAPCLQVNYRYAYRVTPERFDQLVERIRSGAIAEDVPAHGTLQQVRQHIPANRQGVIRRPEELTEAPAWFTARTQESST
jgi:NADH-quinone oxidoreductase subunit E